MSASGGLTLATFSYDALGRRVRSVVGGTTRRFIYGGPTGDELLEERRASPPDENGNSDESVVRSFAPGGRFLDERAASFDASGNGTYFIEGPNHSVIGVMDAQGTLQRRLSYSGGGDFTGQRKLDADGDGDVDLIDALALQNAFGSTEPQDQIFDADQDGVVTLADLEPCLAGPNVAPPSGCGTVDLGPGGPSPVTGDFGLHGRWIDVLPDGHVLMDYRARTYDPRRGRFLQRDPAGFVDGTSLYEGFGGNPLVNLDPYGLMTGDEDDGIWGWLRMFSLFQPQEQRRAVSGVRAEAATPAIAQRMEQIRGGLTIAGGVAAQAERTGTSMMGGVQVVGGGMELVGGVLLVPVYGLGVPVVAHGLDVIQAGSRTASSGEFVPTYTALALAGGLRFSGVPDRYATLLGGQADALISIGGPGAMAGAAKAAVVPFAVMASELRAAGGAVREVPAFLSSETAVAKLVARAGTTTGVDAGLRAGKAGSFVELDRMAVVGDMLTPHHMPQAALGFTSRAEGGAIMIPHAEHVLTRTFGFRGAQLLSQESGTPFRTVLGRDIRDLRSIVGNKYDQGIIELLGYYRTRYPDLLSRP